MESPKQVKVTHTAENQTPINPDQSIVPMLLFGDRVIINPEKPDEMLSKTAGIHAPVKDRNIAYMRGTIASIGGGEYGPPIAKRLKIGLKVAYWHQNAIDFEFDGDKTKYHMVRVSDIFADL
jgi:co-chaperonin GroES (HSP10)